MAARAPLAKLTRPKLYEALPRPRLFALLDEAATRPIVWLCAAPGAGKTTLVASYLEARHRRHLWYQYDTGDADSCDIPALPADRRTTARRQDGGGVAAVHVGAAARPRALRSQLFPRSVLGIATAMRPRVRQLPRGGHNARAARRFRAGAGRGARADYGHRHLARRSAAGVRAPRRKRAHRAHRRSGAPLHRGRSALHPRQPAGGPGSAVADPARKRRLGGRARAVARASSPARRHAGRIARQGQGGDLPVFRGRDLQRRPAGEPARADVHRDRAVDHRCRSRRAQRQRRGASLARIPVPPPPVHRSAPG